jgi:BlaI family transcriptional regulator, penicillinase repressor
MKLDQITDGELSILQVLWERGEAATREIAEEIYGEVTDPKVATVQKLIERLETKGCLTRDRSERAHRYRARVTQERFLRSRLQSLADRLCGGAIAPLMTTLVRSRGLSKPECDELRKLIEEKWPTK